MVLIWKIADENYSLTDPLENLVIAVSFVSLFPGYASILLMVWNLSGQAAMTLLISSVVAVILHGFFFTDLPRPPAGKP
jgi:hypothetical protein